MTLRVAWASDPGLEREENEDSVFVQQPHGGLDALLVVADGMGGHASGQVASKIAVETAAAELADDGDLSADHLRDVLGRVNAAVYAAARANSANSGMGSTLVVAAIDGARLGLLNCGDSPAYLIRGGEVQEIYQNHSWPAEQVRAGILKPEEAVNHPLKHRLARAVGIWDHVKGYASLVELEVGDVVLLCSDGVEEAGISTDELHQLLEHDDLEKYVNAVIQLARERGAPDNVTVAVARVE
jgi:PPM family protein phosphatase